MAKVLASNSHPAVPAETAIFHRFFELKHDFIRNRKYEMKHE